MTTTSVLTLSLATAFGIYALVAGVSLLAAPARWRAAMDEFAGSPALTYVAGVVAFVIGVALILVHDLWTDPLAIAVTLIGWITAVEGLVLIAWPAAMLRLAGALMRPAWLTGYALFAVLLGALLLAGGLTGTAELTR